MSIFVDETTKVVIQGISPTSQGLFHGLRNKAYGTKVVAGTNPKRGGEEIEGIAVYGSVSEAVKETGATASLISVPPRGAVDAIIEAMGRVSLNSPVVMRLDGTNAEAGRALLADHLSDTLIAEPTMLDAARRAVALAKA